MADITVTRSYDFGPTESVTSTKLDTLGVPGVSLDAGTIVDADVSATADIAGSKLANATVTKAKIENVNNMKVLGNTSGSISAPSEVSVLDEDDMNSDSSTALATQQSIKAYVDDLTTFAPSNYNGEQSVTLPNGLIMKFGQATAVKDTTTDVNFDVAFSSAINAQITAKENTASDTYQIKITELTPSKLVLRNTQGADREVHWMVVGY
jgi:hypothetical protein